MHTATVEASERGCGDVDVPTHLFLRLPRKRPRAVSGRVDTEDDEGDLPSLLRLRWDLQDMGASPPALQALAGPSTTSLVFCRLRGGRDAVGSHREAATHPEVHHCGKETVDRHASLHRLQTGSQYMVIDCASPAVEEPTELYVLHDSHRESTEGGDRPVKEQGEDDFDFDGLAVSDTTVSALCAPSQRGAVLETPFKKVEKRQRELETIPTYYLQPVPRKEGMPCPLLSSTAGPMLSWEQVVEPTTVPLWELLQPYEFGVLALTEEEAHAECLADRYCYPDHRHDDEFDSNAEDFSGNDYPEDADGPAACDGDDGDSPDETGGRSHVGRRSHVYGLFCEDEYSERALSSGWDTEDS